jgi:flagellar biosynthesis protein FlhA
MINSILTHPILKHSTIPAGLIGILFILIFPLPTFLLDILIALNITLALVVLFVTLYIEKPLSFSAFPAILLITTIFRLSLNIAATKHILLHGKDGHDAAGNVIQAFGEFVVGGNYFVGAVIFIVISMVNLKVITKGSGRIAEVAARFTLDAMPGKQMAIDSDLNIGLIKDAEAKARRKELSMEAEFYGAMDGAAKFVSGDAIAGVFIIGINIIGGLLIGLIQDGMDWREAAQVYTLLTIGDGLVSQLPSIIISMASGIIVARAASGADLGTEVFGQLAGSPKPLYLTSAVCLLFAILPGLPFVPFVILSGVSALFGYVRGELTKGEEAKQKLEETVQVAEAGPRPGSTEEVSKLLAMDTLELEVGYELVSLVEGGDLVERIRSIRRQFAMDYGFIVPPIHIRDNVRIKPNEYRFLLRGASIGESELKPHYLLAMDPGGVTQEIRGTPTREPAFGLDAIWIADSDKERAQFAGYTVVDLSTVITTHITELIRSNMHELLSRQDVQHLVDTLQKEHPKVVEELIPSMLNVGQVQQVLVHLLKEQISIRDLRTILETLADWAPHVKHPEKLAEFVRKKLSRQITGKFLDRNGMLPLASLSPTVERVLSEALQQTDEGSYLALEPSLAQQLIHRLSRTAERFGEIGQQPLVLAPAHLRAALSNFVSRFVPGFAVMSHHEIAPSTRVQSLGVIALED